MSSKIQVRIQGQDYGVLELHPGMDYFAGRGSDCQIILQNERGISRQHIQISLESDVWTVKLLSRFGGLVLNGEEVEQITLEEGVTFHIGNYEFSYVEEQQVVEQDEVDATVAIPEMQETEPSEPIHDPYSDENQGSVTGEADEVPEPDFGEPEPTEIQPFEDQEYTDEMTMVAATQLTAFLRVTSKPSEPEEILKLDGELWTAGRSPNCEIYINNKNVSRKHFDITKEGGSYFIVDHGSSNGTFVNEEQIVSGEETEIFSGDVIRIKSVHIVFEVRDSQFDKKLAVLPTQPTEDFGSEVEMDYPEELAYMAPAGQAAAVQVEAPSPNAEDGKKKKFFLVLLAILILGGALLFESEPEGDKQTQASKQNNKKDELKEEQLREVKNLYNIARNQYENQRFELCMSQLAKLHSMVPSYEDSKVLYGYCEQAIAIQQENEDRERKQTMASQNEEKIRVITEECKAKISKGTTIEQMRNCMAEAVLIDPENPSITEVLTLVEAQQEQKRLQAEQKAQQSRICASDRRQFEKAQKTSKSGKINKAIKEYQAFLNKNSSCLKDKNEDARRSIASLKEQLKKKVDQQIAICQKLFEEKKYNDALIACNTARKEDPGNRKPQSIMKDIISQACSEQKNMFADATLEEAMGNLDAAKNKFKEIINIGVKKCPQFSKAKRKLKKYGN